MAEYSPEWLAEHDREVAAQAAARRDDYWRGRIEPYWQAEDEKGFRTMRKTTPLQMYVKQNGEWVPVNTGKATRAYIILASLAILTGSIACVVLGIALHIMYG